MDTTAMGDLRAFFGPNAGYVLELYERYSVDPETVSAADRAYFDRLDPNALSALAAGPTSFQTNGAAISSQADVSKIVAAAALAQAIREYGHLNASIDPLGSPLPGAPELDPAFHGITDADLTRLPAAVVSGPASEGAANAGVAIQTLRAMYSGPVGYDFDHIQEAQERLWLQNAVESGKFSAPLETATRRALLRRLTQVESFERFLHQTYLGQKRFSIEGNDVVVPMLDEIVHSASGSGTREVVIGMAHRGRLNVLTHILGKPYAAIIQAFEGKKKSKAVGGDPSNVNDPSEDFSGDVKYHLGARLLRGEHGMAVEVPIYLAPNPSHLEQVNPVIEGMVRASQDITDQPGEPGCDPGGSVAIAIHGDAAFPGQGVVAETLNMAGLRGFSTGGTVHIIINNQVGFTTDPRDSRSTLYASDLAKGFEIPVVHVNADDPEACLSVCRMAMAYRLEFGKDFLIDVVGYRRWGHNEGDEPHFTQPKLYDKIDGHPAVRKVWADRLIASGEIDQADADQLVSEAMDRLAGVRRSVTDGTAQIEEEEHLPAVRREVETAVPESRLREIHAAIHAMPDGFAMTPKLARQWDRRAKLLDTPDGKVDWALAESYAFAAIISDGIPIRMSGQDAERGTFSQRHLVLHDPSTDATYTPLQALPGATASFAIYNSPLSEAAVVGFEYGYSVHAPGRLVIWEAQFGDFSNGAQIIIDQFIASARSKWMQLPSLVMLLPHGYEGQGPEHSSGRLERYLQLSAQDNLRVANCTTAAQYFHLLRRQALRLADDPRPLILMTPKSLLRNPLASSELAEFATGTFLPVLDDPFVAEAPEKVTRVILCSGKVAVDLQASDLRENADNVAIVRIEQLAPFQNTAIRSVLANYPNIREIVWLQEEPRNMGAGSYIEPRLRELVGGEYPITYIGRPDRASPAGGSLYTHNDEQAQIVEAAFANVPTVSRSRNNGARENGKSGVAPEPVLAGTKRKK
jgi:2-oxoglutarate dehydrogenase E1 component